MSQQLAEAVRQNKILLLEDLLKDLTLNVNIKVPTVKPTSDNLVTPLHIAAVGGNIDAVRLLLTREDIDVNAVTDIGKTAMHLAVSYGRHEIVRALVPIASTNIKDILHKTPYELAKSCLTAERLKKSAAECIEILKVPTFVQACADNDLKLVKKMVEEEHVDLNAIFRQHTGLSAACRYANVDIVKYLLTRKNQLNLNMIVNRLGETALHSACTPIGLKRLQDAESIATHAFNEQIKNLPKSYQDNSPLPDDEQRLRVEIANSLIEAGANINAIDNDGDPPIVLATAYNHLDLTRLLVYRGANLFLTIPYDEELKKKYNAPADRVTNPVDYARVINPEIYNFFQQFLRGECLTRKMEVIAGLCIFKEKFTDTGTFFTSSAEGSCSSQQPAPRHSQDPEPFELRT